MNHRPDERGPLSDRQGQEFRTTGDGQCVRNKPKWQVRWGELSASAVLMLAPVLAFVLVFQRRLVRGLTMGAIK